jgi:hypothetical protein
MTSYRGYEELARMIATILISLLAGFFAWLIADMVIEALFPRLMDPSITQRLATSILVLRLSQAG